MAIPPAFAQQEKNDLVIRFSGSYTQVEGEEGDAVFDFKFGKFFTRNIEVGINPILSLAPTESIYLLAGYGTYNFITSNAKLVPYTGVTAGALIIESSGIETITAGTFGFNGGFRYFISEKVNIDTGINYIRYELQDVGVGLLQVNIGFGVILGAVN